MDKKPTAGYSTRIEQALRHGPRPMSGRTLAKELCAAHPDLRGTSYGGVRTYIRGDVRNPRLELLRAIAQVLGVRSAWLAYDDGPMTEEEHRERVRGGAIASATAADREFEAWERAHAVREGVRAGLGLTPYHEMPMIPRSAIDIPYWVAAAWEVGRRLNVDAEDVGRALAGPLQALGVDPDRMGDDALGDYVTAMTPVLLALAPLRPPTP